MKRRAMRSWDIAGAIVIYSLAILWMFVYEWIPHAVSAAVFPVNASAWESVKLFLLPAALFYTAEYFAIGHKFKNYVFARGIGLLVMSLLTVFTLSFYRDILGFGYVRLVDALIPLVCICVGQAAAYRITLNQRRVGFAVLSFIIAGVLLISSILLTFFPPKTGLFFDPVTENYGIEAVADGAEME